MAFRIGIDARMLGSAPGIGRYIEQLTAELFRIDEENEYVMFLREPMYHRYEVPRSRGKEGRALRPRIFKVLAPERWYSVAEQVTFPIRLVKEHLDLFFAPQFNVPLLVPCPFVVTIHDVTQLFMPGPLQQRSRLRQDAFRLVFSHAVRSAEAVIAVSHYTKRQIMEHFDVPEDRIRVIAEGPGLPRPPAGLSGEVREPYLLAVGVWRPHKNFEGLIEAFAILRRNERFKDVRLVLVGEEDPRYPQVRERLEASPLRDAIIVVGTPSDRVLEQWYRRAAVVVVPSFFEGFGFVGLEALSRGIPVVAARAAALPETLGDAAAYFDPRNPQSIAEAIAKVLSDPSERERILSSAQAVLARYSWENAARETHEVLLSVLQRMRKEKKE
jgi:glycosyltransferase involved in cell wall biosynthesis